MLLTFWLSWKGIGDLNRILILNQGNWDVLKPSKVSIDHQFSLRVDLIYQVPKLLLLWWRLDPFAIQGFEVSSLKRSRSNLAFLRRIAHSGVGICCWFVRLIFKMSWFHGTWNVSSKWCHDSRHLSLAFYWKCESRLSLPSSFKVIERLWRERTHSQKVLVLLRQRSLLPLLSLVTRLILSLNIFLDREFRI